MFKIGDFSRIARVSARLLRFYDDIGLLKPQHADTQSGYRYYSAAQLSRLNRILVLKELGFSLEEVGRILDQDPDAAELRAMLLVRRRDVESALEVEARRLRSIEMRIAQIESEGRFSLEDVIVRSEPARRLLSLRRVIPSFAAARELIQELRVAARRAVAQGRLGALMIIAHAHEFDPGRLDAEFGFTLDDETQPRLEGGDELTIRELPAVDRMAVCVRVGLPEDAHLATAKIGRYIEASGDELAGPSREFFLQLPPPERMHEAVVEMQFPIARAAATGLAEQRPRS